MDLNNLQIMQAQTLIPVTANHMIYANPIDQSNIADTTSLDLMNLGTIDHLIIGPNGQLDYQCDASGHYLS